jgi:hypothetical protein
MGRILLLVQQRTPMTLSEISEISQTVGSAAIVASLVFVGVQIRHNTKATQAASHDAVSKALNRINLLWARDGEAARIWLAGMQDRRALTPEERWRFDSTLRAYLHVCETMYTQADLGAGDLGIVLAEENGIKAVFSSAGVREWWAQNPFGFSIEFRNYIVKLAGPFTPDGKK